MSDWIVRSITFADPASMSDGTGLLAGRYWHGQVEVLTPVYERRLFGYPGVDGLAVKAFGFRGRSIRGEIAYIASDLAALRSMIEQDRTALANTTFGTVPPQAGTFYNCQLEALPDGPVSSAGNGLLIMRTALSLLQLRP